jgi:hypothetical protein
MLGGAPGSAPEPRFPLLPPLLSIFRPKTTANSPIDNAKDNEKRDSSINSKSMKMQILGQIALNYPHRMNIFQL